MGTDIFLGYRTAPGGKWTGDYIIAELNGVAGKCLHSTTEPAPFRCVRPHITGTVNGPPNGTAFPLFEQSIKHNETIEGIEDCEINMTRERTRRKNEVIHPAPIKNEAKVVQNFAQFTRIKLLPPGAGFDVQPTYKLSLPDLKECETPDEFEVLDTEKPFAEWGNADQFDAYALPSYWATSPGS